MGETAMKTLCGCCLENNNLTIVNDYIVNLLSSCFSIQLINFSAEESSAFICVTCFMKAKDSYDFRSQILCSQLKLKKLYVSTNFICNLKTESRNDFPVENSIKEELTSDIEDPINSLIIQNQNNKDCKTVNGLKNEEIESDTKNEVKSNKKMKKKLSKKNVKIIDKSSKQTITDHKYPSTARPYKLDKNALICEVCKENFTGHILLQAHMATHYPNFICDICGKPFVLNKNLQNHIKIHNQEKVSCTICKKNIKAICLRVHMLTHSNDVKRYVCPHCAQRFSSLYQRAKHMEENHNIDVYKLQCKYCSKKFIMSSVLSAHIRRYHTKESNRICSTCGKAFYSSGEFKRHLVTHTGEKNYQCDVCTKTFSKKWSLTLHMRNHTGDVQKYKCIHCEKEFTQNGSLRVHIKNIHREKIL